MPLLRGVERVGGAVFTRGVLVPRCPVTDVPRVLLERVGAVTREGDVRELGVALPVVTRCGLVLRERVLVTWVLRFVETPLEFVERVAAEPLTDDDRVDFATSFVRGSSDRLYPYVPRASAVRT